MYDKPKLLRYGSFRDLTQAGVFGFNDQAFFQANAAGGNASDGTDPTPGPSTAEVGSR